MAQIERRIGKLEAHGTPAPELVNAWVLWLRGMEAIPGIAGLMPEERVETAKAQAAMGKSPSTVWLEALQEVWAEEGLAHEGHAQTPQPLRNAAGRLRHSW